MDWSTEPYVRLYIRDTTTWRMLSWEAQAIFPNLMKYLDRAGRLDLDGVSPVDAVCAALPKWPEAVVEAGLASLAARKVIVVTDVAIIAAKFEAAQNAQRADKVRAAEYRARRRDEALGSARDGDGVPVTQRHEPSHGVTENHSPIAVLPVPELPVLAVPTQAADHQPHQPTLDDPDDRDDPEVRSFGTLVEPDPPTVHDLPPRPTPQPSVEQALHELAMHHGTFVGQIPAGAARERVRAARPVARGDAGAQNLNRELDARGLDGVLEVLRWGWGEAAAERWDPKHIAFAFSKSGGYFDKLVAERAATLGKADAVERAAKRRAEIDRVEAERAEQARASPATVIDIDAINAQTRRLRTPRATA